MTDAASKRPRATPPPLPSTYTSGVSGVRPLAVLLSAGASPCLRHVSVRVDDGKSERPADADGRTQRESELTVEFAQDSQFVVGLSEDLSCGGIFVATYRRLPLGTAVRLGIELPNGHVVEACGVVRWTRERDDGVDRQGLGVLFTEVSDGALAAIADYCRLRPPLYFEL